MRCRVLTTDLDITLMRVVLVRHNVTEVMISPPKVGTYTLVPIRDLKH